MKGSVLQRLAAMQMNDINEEREEYQASQALARRMWRLKLSKMLKEWRNHVLDIRWGLNRITDVFARRLRRILKGVLQQWRDASSMEARCRHKASIATRRLCFFKFFQ